MESKPTPTERTRDLKSVGVRIEGQGQIPTARRDKKSERHIHPRNHTPKDNAMDIHTQQHESKKHKDDTAREPHIDAEPATDPVVARMNHINYGVNAILNDLEERKTVKGQAKRSWVAFIAAAAGAAGGTAFMTWLMRSKVLPPVLDSAVPIPGMKK